MFGHKIAGRNVGQHASTNCSGPIKPAIRRVSCSLRVLEGNSGNTACTPCNGVYRPLGRQRVAQSESVLALAAPIAGINKAFGHARRDVSCVLICSTACLISVLEISLFCQNNEAAAFVTDKADVWTGQPIATPLRVHKVGVAGAWQYRPTPSACISVVFLPRGDE